MVNELSRPYLATLYANVENLNYFLALYNNLLLQISNKYGGVPADKLLSKVDQGEKNTLIQILNSIRQNSIVLFVKISSIKPTVPDFVTDENFNLIQEKYTVITTTVVPDYLIVQEFCILINSLFISGIGADIARSGQEYFNQLSNINAGSYNNEQRTQEEE